MKLRNRAPFLSFPEGWEGETQERALSLSLKPLPTRCIHRAFYRSAWSITPLKYTMGGQNKHERYLHRVGLQPQNTSTRRKQSCLHVIVLIKCRAVNFSLVDKVIHVLSKFPLGSIAVGLIIYMLRRRRSQSAHCSREKWSSYTIENPDPAVSLQCLLSPTCMLPQVSKTLLYS